MRLLLRLDPDMTRAGEKYVELRHRLAKFFEWNNCAGAQDLADEVLDRVAAKADSEEIRAVDQYSYGVARFVCLETHKKMHREISSEDLPGGENALVDDHNQSGQIVDRLDGERRLACLRQCLAKLAAGDRELAVQYYSAEEKKQKTFRRELAKKAELTLAALRVRMNRLRAQLELCVTRCLAVSSAEAHSSFVIN